MSQPVHRRVIVKLSGEALAGNQGSGIDQATIDRVAADLVAAQKLGIAIGVVVGGGNIFRGVEVSSRGVSRQTGDMMGMLATVMNGLALEAAIERAGAAARSALGARRPAGLRILFQPARAQASRCRGGSWCCRAARVIRISRPTPRPCCAPASCNARRCSRPPMWTASTAPTPSATRPPSVTTGSTTRRPSRRTSKSWTPPPSRLPAKTLCLSLCFRSASRGPSRRY